MIVRQVTNEDAAAIQAIYAPFVTDTTISFEDMPPDLAEIKARIAGLLPDYPYLIADEGDQMLGFAYASPHRSRAAYRSSIDVSVYGAPDAQRRGVGRSLTRSYCPTLQALGTTQRSLVSPCQTKRVWRYTRKWGSNNWAFTARLGGNWMLGTMLVGGSGCYKREVSHWWASSWIEKRPAN